MDLYLEYMKNTKNKQEKDNPEDIQAKGMSTQNNHMCCLQLCLYLVRK